MASSLFRCPCFSENPPFKVHGALGIFLHLDIVVAFDDESVTAGKPFQTEGAQMPQIRGDAHFHPLICHDEADRVRGIVRNGEWPDPEGPDAEVGSALETFTSLPSFP